MNIDHLKNLLSEFDKNIKFNCDLKKKNWFNIEANLKYFTKQKL